MQQYLSANDLALLRTSLIAKLNKERQSLNLESLYRCRRGDITAQELINKNITSTVVGSGFQEVIRNNKVLADHFEILTFQHTHQAFLQMPLPDEAKDGFQNAFENMFKQNYSNILLNRCQMTHLSLGMKQDGVNGEDFQILILMSIKPITILQVLSAGSDTQGEAKISVGAVLTNEMVPTLIVIDEGLPTEFRLGTSQIIFDPTNSQELKFAVFDNQVQHSPFNKKGQSTTVDIYMVNSNCSHVINYGGGEDAQYQQNWKLAYSDIMPKNIQSIPMQAFTALQNPNLRETIKKTAKAPSSLQQRLMNKNRPATSNVGSGLSNQISSAIGNVNNMIGGNTIRKTNAQILKEKKAKELRDRQNTSSNQSSVIALGPSMTVQNDSFGNNNILQNQNCFKSGFQIQQSSNQNSFKSRGNVSFGIDNQSFLSNKDQGKFGHPNQQAQNQNNAWKSAPFQSKPKPPSNQRSQWPVAQSQQNQFNAQRQNNVSQFSFNGGSNTLSFKPSNQISQPAQPQNSQFIVGRQENKENGGMIQSKLKFSSNNPFAKGSSSLGAKKIEAMPLKQTSLNFNPSQQPSKSPTQPLIQNTNFNLNQNQTQVQQPLKFNFIQPSSSINQNEQKKQIKFQPMNLQPQQQFNFQPPQHQLSQPQQQFLQPQYQPHQINQQHFQSQQQPFQPFQTQQMTFKQPLQLDHLNLSDLQQKIMRILEPHLDHSFPLEIIMYELQRLENLLQEPNKNQDQIQQLQIVEDMIVNQPTQFLTEIARAHGLLQEQQAQFRLDQSEKKAGLFQSENVKELTIEDCKKMMGLGEKGQFVMSMVRFDQIEKQTFEDVLQKVWNSEKPEIQSAASTQAQQATCNRMVDSILRLLYLKELPPKNDSFVELYKEHLDASQDLSSRAAKESDLSLLLRGNKFKCHQFIFKNNS